MSEKDRITVLEIAREDSNSITVGDAVNVFCSTLALCEKTTNTFKNVKKKLGKEDYIKFITALSNSFVSTLYVNSSKDEQEFEERYKLITEANADIIHYEQEIREDA